MKHKNLLCGVRLVFLVLLVITIAAKRATAQTNIGPNQTTSVPNVPSSAVAGGAKVPGGMQNLLLGLLAGGGSLDMSSMLQLLTLLGPQLIQVPSSNVSGLADSTRRCYEDVNAMMTGMSNGAVWATNMVDASGKPGSSILRGNTKFYGDFDQCLSMGSDVLPDTRRRVKGDTCVVGFIPPPEIMALPVAVPSFMPITFHWDMCVPDTCDGLGMRGVLKSSMDQFNTSITTVVCHSEIKDGPIGQDPAALCASVLVAILCSLVLLGSLLDLYNRSQQVDAKTEQSDAKQHITCTKLTTTTEQNGKIAPEGIVIDALAPNGNAPLTHGIVDKETGSNGVYIVEETGRVVNGISNGHGPHANGVLKTEMDKGVDKTLVPVWQRVLLCFSAVSNGERVLSVRPSPGSLTCLNGIRVMSMGWVILGHTFAFMLQIADIPANAADIRSNLFFQTISNGTLSVDSFFMLSGLLVTYLFLKETDKRGGVSAKQMILYYVHRYWRLTPAYAFMIFASTCLVPYMVDGPTWQGLYDRVWCQDNWWINLLYVNNVVRRKKQCFGVAWYLANDMQFYVVAPLALIPLALSARKYYEKHLKMAGLFVIIAFVITSITCTAYFTYDIGRNMFSNSDDYMGKVYYTPWCRIGTFAIGMMFGYILHASKKQIQVSPFVQGVGWILALVATGAVTLSTYDQNRKGGTPWGVEANTAHETLFRPVWALVLGWVITMCCSGYGGVVDWMLSWSWWQPLARLTYGAFLMHPVIMFAAVGTATQPFHYTEGNLVVSFFGYASLSYITSFMLAILVEAPFLQLEKLAFKH